MWHGPQLPDGINIVGAGPVEVLPPFDKNGGMACLAALVRFETLSETLSETLCNIAVK